MSGNAEQYESEVVLCGVSLLRYAAVRAGLAEGLGLAVVLEREGIPAEVWPGADQAWSAQLLRDIDAALRITKALANTSAPRVDTIDRTTSPRFGPPPPVLHEQRAGGSFAIEATLAASEEEEAVFPAPPQHTRRGIFSLEGYAALCAEVAAFPGTAERTFERHGLALERKRVSTDLRWRNRLRQNPSEHQEWERLYRRYYALFALRARQGAIE